MDSEGNIRLQLSGFGNQRAEHIRALGRNSAEVDRPKRGYLAAAEQKDVSDDPAGAADFLQETAQPRLRRARRSGFLHRDLEMTAERGEQIVEMMRDPAGESSERFILAQAARVGLRPETL